MTKRYINARTGLKLFCLSFLFIQVMKDNVWLSKLSSTIANLKFHILAILREKVNTIF